MGLAMASKTQAGRSSSRSCGPTRPRNERHARLDGKSSRHHLSHRFTVVHHTPSTAFSFAALQLRGSRWRSAATPTTVAPQYTFRPKNSTDGGRVRRRQ